MDVKDIKIKDVVKDNYATFSHLRHSIAYYTVPYEGSKYQFDIPLSDLGEATLNYREKAIHLMRYIRISMENGSFVYAGECI